jgi:peroxiredoxin
MSLQTELDAFRSAWAERVGPGIVDTIRKDNEALAKSGIVDNALKAGDVFPGLSLPDQRGRQRDLKAMFTEAPLVVTFYRGGWCPYCSLELRAYQQALSEIERYGAKLVAVSPETPNNTLTTTEKNDLAFPVLSDVQGRLADALGIRFSLSQTIRDLYVKFGHDLPTHNGDGRWSLPIPATYVVAKGGRIALAHVDPDYRNRLEPQAALEALRKLQTSAAA